MQAELRLALRLALAHHPLCNRFAHDRFGPLCSGCALFVPALLASVIIAPWLVIAAGAWAMLAAAGVLGIPQVIGAFWRFSRPVRGAVKGLGGAAVGAATWAVLLLPVAWGVRAGLVALFLIAVVVLSWFRLRSILHTCDTCPWQRDWARCPGFGALDP